MNNRNPAISFTGPGVLNKGLALALAMRNYRVVASYSRNANSAQRLADHVPGCQVVGTTQELTDAVAMPFITTPDSVIEQIAASQKWRPDQGVAHRCGATSTEILKPASDQGAKAGALHPFQTLVGVADTTDAAASATGPVIRADIASIRTNLETLFLRLSKLVSLYSTLAATSLPFAASRRAEEPTLRNKRYARAY